jgi:hypothetical protein
VPLPWEELQPEVEHLTGMAGLKIIQAVIEDELTRRVGPRHQPDAASGCLRWGQQLLRDWNYRIQWLEKWRQTSQILAHPSSAKPLQV